MRERSGVLNTGLAEKPEILKSKNQTKQEIFQELVKREERCKILEAQLIRAQKLETLGALVSGIAHDFNNILNVIVGYSQLLPDMISDPDEFTKAVEAISNASNRGAELVKQLLTFIKKSKSDFTSVEVNGIIYEIKKLIKNTFPKIILVSLDLEKDLPKISADPTQIHQVLLNLCINSRDAMQKGGLIYIKTKITSHEFIKISNVEIKPCNYVEIMVQDTGTGMKPEICDRIFDPFFTTKNSDKGTGLGLSLVYSIIKNHHGYITVKSKIRKGTSFYIYLPIQENISENIDNSIKPVHEYSGCGETILIIEDDEDQSKFISKILTSKGYSIITAKDGDEGVVLFDKNKNIIELVILDLELPLIEGEDVFKIIKSIKPDTKIIIASGSIEQELIKKLNNAGVKYFIEKPYSPNKILQMISDIIGRK